jgi:hypothetical protein
MIFSSSKDKERSTTRAFTEDPPCTHTYERGQREETSDGDFSGRSDSVGADGGVLAPLGDGLPSLEGERARLVPLLFSIDGERRSRKVNPR